MADDKTPLRRPTIDMVREFHLKFLQPARDVPTEPTKQEIELRLNLIAEEFMELADACGYLLTLNNLGGNHTVRMLQDPEKKFNPIDAADALGDLDYVVAGAHLYFGFDGTAVVTEIHRSNMSKLGADGFPIFRSDGKVLKGPNYTKPDFRKVLTEQQGASGAKQG